MNILIGIVVEVISNVAAAERPSTGPVGGFGGVRSGRRSLWIMKETGFFGFFWDKKVRKS